MQRSRSSGKLYYFDSTTGKSIWFDSELPEGWGKDPSTSGSDSFLGLWTGTATQTRPTEPDGPVTKRGRIGGVADAGKRPKIASQAAEGPVGKVDAGAVASTIPQASPSAASSVGSGRDAVTAASGVVGDPSGPAVATPLPRMPQEWSTTGFPDSRPTDVSPAIEAFLAGEAASRTPLFAAEHQLVLAQMIDAAATTALKGASGRVTVLDLGAGLGRATAFAIDAVQKRNLSATVFAVDIWHAPFAAAVVRNHGHRELARALRALADADTPPSTTAAAGAAGASSASVACGAAGARPRPGPTYMAAFCRHLWAKRDSVVPVRALLPMALHRLRGDGVEPDVVWIDAELDRTRLRRLIRAVIELFPGAAICGGGWNLSPSVQLAVADIVRAVKLAQRSQAAAATEASPGSATAPDGASHPCPRIPVSLHVERRKAWTLAGGLVGRTRNKEGAAPSLAAPRVAAEDVEEAVSAEAWLGRVVQLINAGDDGARVWALCKGHGRPRAAALAGEASTAPGAIAGDDASRVWIDNVQSGAKRQPTALMWAAKKGRRDITRALLAAGARVNVQADKSQYSALIVAAFGGHDHVTRLLLRAGARLDLRNKFNETAEMTAHKPIILSLLRAAARAGPSAPPAELLRAVGRSSHDTAEDHKRDDDALAGRFSVG